MRRTLVSGDAGLRCGRSQPHDDYATAGRAAGSRRFRRQARGRRLFIFTCATLCATVAMRLLPWSEEGMRPQAGPAFFKLDEKDGRFCGKEGDICKCHGHVRYGRLFLWSDDIIADGIVNCSAASFGDPLPLNVKICKCYPTICTTDVGTCTAEPCECPRMRGADFYWAKNSMMTSDGAKCWACERRASAAGIAIDQKSPFCPVQAGRCTLNRDCKCEYLPDTKRTMRTKEGRQCWTCSTVHESGTMHLDSGQKAMFWMLPMLWPFMDLPQSMWQVLAGCRTLTTFLGLCIIGYICQSSLQFLKFDRYLSFFAPCLKKGEFWRLFTYFMLHSDLQHLAVNLFHLMDTLDLEAVPDMEISPGVSLRCTRNGPISSICYPDIGIGRAHTIALIALVLAYGCLVGSVRNYGALVQGASSVCFGVDGALIALYALFLGADLDSRLRIPEFGSFFWMRIGIIVFHIILDLFQSLCSGGKDTVGTLAHMASFIAGFCYVVVVHPPMGDGSLFESRHPYVVNCGQTNPRYISMDDATTECLAFFSRANGIEVTTAKAIGAAILGGGVLVSMVHAFANRHIGDDGIACCAHGNSNPGHSKESGALPAEQPRIDVTTMLRQSREQIRQRIVILERLYANIPDPSALPQTLEPARLTHGLTHVIHDIDTEQFAQS